MHTSYEFKVGDLVVVLSSMRQHYGPGYAEFVSKIHSIDPEDIDPGYVNIVPVGKKGRREPGGFFAVQLKPLCKCSPEDLEGLRNLDEIDPMFLLRPLEELDV
jgi:hypothetical protein